MFPARVPPEKRPSVIAQHLVVQTLTGERTGDGEHLAHPRAAARAFVADDDDVAFLDLASRDRAEASSSPSKTRAGPRNGGTSSADLEDRTVGREAAVEDRDTAFVLERASMPGWTMSWSAGNVTSARFSAMVLPVTVMQSPCSRPASSSSFMHDREAADPVEVGHHVLAARLEVRDVRRAPGDAVEVVDRDVDLCVVRDRRDVQTAFVDPPTAQQTAIAFSNASRVMMSRGRMPRFSMSRTASPEALDSSSRRTSSIAGIDADIGSDIPSATPIDDIVFAVNMPAHAPGPGHAARSRSPEIVFAHRPGRDGTDAFDDVDVGDVVAVVGARHDRPAVLVDGREVKSRDRHDHRGLRLVAAADREDAVEPLGMDDQLDRVGDHLAARERRAHPFVTHRDAVRDGDGVELERDAAGAADALAPPTSRPGRGSRCTA